MLEKLDERAPQIGRFAWVMAWVGLVVGQLHALARFRTADGLEDLEEYPLTAAWAEPADDLLSPLLDWASADVAYVMYGKIWFPVFLAFTLCAIVVHRRRQPRGFEEWAWRAALLVFLAATLGVFLTYWTQWTGSYEVDGVEAALFTAGTWVTFPAFFLMLLTATVLGVTLLVKRFRPVLPAVLLALMIPLAFGIVTVTSLGSAALPVMFAFGILGRRLARTADLTRPAPRTPAHA